MLARMCRVLPTAVLALALLLLSASAASAAPPTTRPAVGQDAPPLGAETLLQAPDGASADWADLRGRVVVVEFWATWCAPCVQAIPHLNELIDATAGQDITFIAVTDESRESVERLTGRLPMKAWVGLDPDFSAGTAYGVTIIPRTIVVGRDGRIAADTYPTALTADHLRAVLAGQPIDLPSGPSVDERPTVPLSPRGSAAAPTPVVEAWLRPTASAPGEQHESSMMGADEITMTNMPAVSVVTVAYNGRNAGPRLSLDAPLPDGRFDVYVRVPEARAFQIDDLLWETVAFSFGLQREVRDVETDVYLLRLAPGGSDRLRAAGPGRVIDLSESGDATLRLDLSTATARQAASRLDRLWGTPVVDDTGRAEPFDLRATVPIGASADEASINAGLAGSGLEVVAARRAIPTTVVTRRPTSAEEYEASRRPATHPADATTGPTTDPAVGQN